MVAPARPPLISVDTLWQILKVAAVRLLLLLGLLLLVSWKVKSSPNTTVSLSVMIITIMIRFNQMFQIKSSQLVSDHSCLIDLESKLESQFGESPDQF